jgi:HPt (histidine-containing phosphotransfer) domain-containing protein
VEEQSLSPTESQPESDSTPRLLNLDMLQAASGGDPNFVTAILAKMSKKMPEAMDELRAALHNEEWEVVRAVAHRTKSSAAFTGAEILRTKFKEMEHAAMEPDRRGEVPLLMDEVGALVAQVVAEIDAELAQR